MIDMREAFEVWAADYFTDPNKAQAIFFDDESEIIKKDDAGDYIWPEVRDSWAAWQAAQSVPGFVLVPVESAKFCATMAKLHAEKLQRYCKEDSCLSVTSHWQPHINALLDAVEQENTNAK